MKNYSKQKTFLKLLKGDYEDYAWAEPYRL